MGKLGASWVDDADCRREEGMALASTRTIAKGTRVHVFRPGQGEYAYEFARDVEPGEPEPYTIHLPPSPSAPARSPALDRARR